MFVAAGFILTAGALPAHLAELCAGVDEPTAVASSRCERSEDVHVCPVANAAQELGCETALGAAVDGGTRPAVTKISAPKC